MFNGLYHLDTTDFVDVNDSLENNCAFAIKCNENELWHYRLGHLSNKRLAVLQRQFPDIFVPTNFVCEVCMRSKLKRLPFKLSATTFDLIHMDIWGPTVVSLNGSKYFFDHC